MKEVIKKWLLRLRGTTYPREKKQASPLDILDMVIVPVKYQRARKQKSYLKRPE